MKLTKQELLILYRAMALSRDKLMQDKRCNRCIVWDLHAKLFQEAFKLQEKEVER